MIKKYYTLLIASESNHINRSFKVSRLVMSLILILILILFILAYIGFTYQFNINKHAIEINRLKKFENSIVDIINNQIEFKEESDSLIVREIYDVVNNQISKISFLAPVDGYVTQSIDSMNNNKV